MQQEEVDIFLKLQPQLKSAYEEISLLSKKKPTDQVNNFKLKFINSILARANTSLADKYRPFPEEFDLFLEDEMPNNGDVVFILGHYLTSLEKLRCDNIGDRYGIWYWKIDGEILSQETTRPTIK